MCADDLGLYKVDIYAYTMTKIYIKERHMEDDEVFAEFDALIAMLNSLPRPSVTMLNQGRVEEMKFAADMIRHTLKETGSEAHIECKQHELDPGIGIITVEGIELTFVDMEGFARAAEFASNFEVYPLVQNKVRMAYAFYGLVTPLAD